jgi:hypothetical protein
VVNNPLRHTDSSGHAIDGYYPSYSDYAGLAFLGVAVVGAGYLAADPYSAQRVADSVAALATDLVESAPLNSGPALVNHTGGPAVMIDPIATVSFPLGPGLRWAICARHSRSLLQARCLSAYARMSSVYSLT